MDIKESLEDYSRKPVPESKSVSGWHVGLIVIGMSVTVGAFVTGSQIGSQMGFYQALEVYVTASLILAVIANFTGGIGASSRLSTPMIMQFSFGETGARIVAILIAVTLLGWFAVTANLFAQSLQIAVRNLTNLDVSWRVWVVFGGVLMVGTTVFGFKGIDRLSWITVPIMLLFFLVCAYLAIDVTSWAVVTKADQAGLSKGVAISAIAGGGMVAATLFPDYCRYILNFRHAAIASFLGFGLGYALVMVLATIPALAFDESDFVKIVTLLGLGFSALAVMLFATWTTNAANLYSNTLIFSTLFIHAKRWHITLVIGAIGTAIGLINVLDYLIPFLVFLGVAVPPIAGIYVADFFFVNGRSYDVETLSKNKKTDVVAFFAWLSGFVVGYASSQDWVALTTIPACDALAIAFLVYLGLKRLPMIGNSKL